MTIQKGRASKSYGRDYVTLLVSIVVFFIGWFDHDYTGLVLQVEWYADFGNMQHFVQSVNISDVYYHPPIIADLEGDGLLEVVVASLDPPQIAVMHAQESSTQSKHTIKSDKNYKIHGKRKSIFRTSAIPLNVNRVASLLDSLSISKGRKPIAIKAGRISTETVKDKILVLTEDWNLICFDEELHKEWEIWLEHPAASIGHKEIDHDQIEIEISNISLTEGQLGTIFVFGSMSGFQRNKTWFSAFAVEGLSGRIVWKTEVLWDDKKKNYPYCTQLYGKQFLSAVLPHSWTYETDNRIEIVEFNLSVKESEELLAIHHNEGIFLLSRITGSIICKEDLISERLYVEDLKSPYPAMKEVYFSSEDCSLVFRTILTDQIPQRLKLCPQPTSETQATTPILVEIHEHRLMYLLLSNGEILAVDPDGRLVWRKQINAAWDITSALGSFVPSIKTFTLKPYEHQLLGFLSNITKTYMVCVAFNNVNLIELDSGKVEASLYLPSPPLTEASIGDFNHDGVEDIVVTTAYGTVGIGIKRAPPGIIQLVLTSLLLFFVGLIVLIVVIERGAFLEAKMAPALRSTDMK